MFLSLGVWPFDHGKGQVLSTVIVCPCISVPNSYTLRTSWKSQKRGKCSSSVWLQQVPLYQICCSLSSRLQVWCGSCYAECVTCAEFKKSCCQQVVKKPLSFGLNLSLWGALKFMIIQGGMVVFRSNVWGKKKWRELFFVYSPQDQNL